MKRKKYRNRQQNPDEAAAMAAVYVHDKILEITTALSKCKLIFARTLSFRKTPLN
jgi:hypothetical protein